MPISQLPGQDQIITQLKTIPGVDVYEGQYLTDGSMPDDANSASGLFKPYITTIFGSSYEGEDRGIVSERLNPLRTTVTVYAISPGDNLTRQLLDRVRDKMLGFVPIDGTELSAYGGYTFVDADLGVNRYVHAAVFEYTTNMSY